MNYYSKRVFVAAVMAAIFVNGCGAAGHSASHETESAADYGTQNDADHDAQNTEGAADLPASFQNLAEGSALTQTADEQTHIQTNVLDLGGEETVGYFRILWPDLNVQRYEIEGSADGETYETLYEAESAPYFAEDLVELGTPTVARYIRFSGIAASALPVPEVYAENPWTSVEAELSVYLAQDANEHTLVVLTGVPDGIEASFGGCNYDEVVTEIPEETPQQITGDTESATVSSLALVRDTIEDRTVTVGYTLSAQTATGVWTYDTKDYEVQIPAQNVAELAGEVSGTENRRVAQDRDSDADSDEATSASDDDTYTSDVPATVNPRPAVIPAIQEWQGGQGYVEISYENAEWIQAGRLTDSADGRIRYELVDDEGLGEEGYRIDLGCGTAEEDGIRVCANTETGLRWGNVTLRQMIVLAGSESDVEDTENAESVEGTEGAAATKDTEAASWFAVKDLGDTSVLLARGRIRDYPIGEVRGIMLDVGRNTMSLSQIEQIARNLAWFKMNELTLHLQDNALLTYSDKTDSVENARTAYSAYRMESSITGEDGTSITAGDLSYTAEEFAALVERAAEFGVSIIPEIDTPAHSLALTSAFPELGLSGRPDAVDMLDCSNEEVLSLAQNVWDEQLENAFAGVTTIQIGGDEYYGQGNDFVNYESGLIAHLASSGKQIRMWGSLTALLGETRIRPALTNSRIQMQLWSGYWADPLTMYRAGFDLINSSSDKLYINCGEASDYLNKENLYNTYRRTQYVVPDGSTETLPDWSPRVIGSVAAQWNDLIDNLEIGISEYDMTDRVLDALPVLADLFWQEDDARSYEVFTEDAGTIGLAPDSDPLHQSDALTMGPSYEVSFEVYLPSAAMGDAGIDADDSATESPTVASVEAGPVVAGGDGDDADGLVLTGGAYDIFYVSVDGNTYAFKARQDAGDGEGRVGFSREFYDYAFDYTLPTDTWVRLTVAGEQDATSLYVNGELADTIGSSNAYEEHATFLFPTQVNEAFVGEVRNIEWK